MYGLMRHCGCRLDPAARREWQGHVCGVCLGLKAQFGQAARLATNYDAALLTVLCQAQAEEPVSQRESACPCRSPAVLFCGMRSPLRLPIDDPASAPVRFAAGIALLIAAAKLWDHVQDGDRLPRALVPAARRLARRQLAAAEKRLGDMGFDAGQVRRQLEAQTSVESRPGQAFSAYSRPTELAVGAVFAHTAVLALQPANYDPLYEMGRSFGRIMLRLSEDSAAQADAGSVNELLLGAHPGCPERGRGREI